MKINTNCKGCVFSTGDENGQTGCALDRDKLLGAQIDQEGNFILQRFCNTYRPESWIEGLTLEESLNRNKTVLSEVYPRIGLFVRLTDSKDAVDKLNVTLESIKFDLAYIVVITPKVEYNEEVLNLLDSKFKETIKYHIVQLSSPESIDEYLILDEAFPHAQNGWIYITSCGKEIPDDLLDRINDWVNFKMKQLIMVKPYDGMDGLLFQALLFKFVNGNKTKLYQDEYMDSRSFIDKIEAAQERTEEKCIFTTEEFFND